jgi:chemotaxis signal transduction protein
MHPPNPNSPDNNGAKEQSSQSVPDSKLRDVVPFIAGDRVFAIYAAQVDGTAEAKIPTPLPHATNAVLGVVCVRGRMLTVLDPVALVTGEPGTWSGILPCVIALSGDEQLALAAETCRDKITIDDADIERAGEDNGGAGPAAGLIRYGGEEMTVLNPERLFASAMQRRERRRRRF